MNAYEIAAKAMIVTLENQAFEEWDFMNDFQKEIYRNREEYAEVKIRETIHRLSVEFGLMK